MSAEHRVPRAFLLVFFGIAAVLIASTWVRKAKACDAQCIAAGTHTSHLRLSGGGRFNMSIVCTCASADEAK